MSLQISKRLSSIPASPTVKLNSLAKKMKLEGKDIISMAVGEPDFDTPPKIIDLAIESLKKGRTKYGTPGGGLEIRQAIQKKLDRENNFNVDADQIVVGMGAKEILLHTFMSILNEGDEVILLSPYWVSYHAQVNLCGAKPVIVPTEALEKNGLQSYITSKTKALVLTSPNNPDGSVLSNTTLERIAKSVKDKDIWILSDEIYEYMNFEGTYSSLLSVAPELKNCFIVINGCSKSFAMTGWRVGYGAGPKHVMKSVKTLQSHSSTCLPGFIEDAATYAISQGAEYVKDFKKSLKDRRDYIIDLLKGTPLIKFEVPAGAFYLYVDISPALEKSKNFERTDSIGFSEYLLNEHLLAATPGEAFGTPGYLRMTYALSRKDIETGIQRFKNALKQITD